jgi:hypothetical protein
MDYTLEQLLEFIGKNAHLIFPGIAAILFFPLTRQARLQVLMRGLPLSKTKGVFVGFVKVVGTAESHLPLASYLAESHCVFYQATVSEHYIRTRTVTRTDSKGRTYTTTETYSGWDQVHSVQDRIVFELEDETGRVHVNPAAAQMEGDIIFEMTVNRGHPLYYEKGPHTTVSGSTGRRRFTEEAILLDRKVLVVGDAAYTAGAPGPVITKDEDTPLFMVTTKDDRQLSKRFSGWVWALVILIALLPSGGFMLATYLKSGAVDWSCVGLSATVTWPILIIFRFIMIFNGLKELRVRVHQAVSLVDVQLQRRLDLIPNLVEVSKAYSEYEQKLQLGFTSMRAFQKANSAIPMFLGLFKQRGEAYPELKSNETFLRLQRELADTEDRISLARNYLVQIVANYNTQLSSFPFSIVGALTGMRESEPPEIVESDYQRNPVSV